MHLVITCFDINTSASLAGGRNGLSFEDQAFLDAYMRTELDLLSDPDGSKHLIAGFMLGGGAAAEDAAAAEANVAAQVGKNAAAEESWFGRIWNAWLENPNRSTSTGLSACSSACDSEGGMLAGAANANGALTRSQIDEILNIASGSRPNPASYMSQAAIDDLLAKFTGAPLM